MNPQRLLRKIVNYFLIRNRLSPELHDDEWIETALRKVPNYGSGVNRRPLDRKYWVCSQEVFARIVKWDWVDQRKYRADKFDCDNFALIFMARVNGYFGLNNVGLVIDDSSGHAYNIVIFKDGSIHIFEPQSDSWPDIGDAPLYKLQRGLILI